jgi:tRNA(Ile)-lysidine synthase
LIENLSTAIYPNPTTKNGMIEDFSAKISELFSTQKLPKKIAVALSGGADSLALTLLLQNFCNKKKIKLFAVTVDHKMRAASSFEALALGKLCKQKEIFHQILTLQKSQLPKSNVEAQLREMRYEALHEFCLQNKIEFLFLGHQLDDVAENFLIRLFRGSGLDGLAAMQEVSDYKKIKLVRPLLSCSKDELKKFLQQQKVSWFEDETNIDEKFLRNKIRNFLSSFEDKNLLQKRIKISAEEIAQIRDEFDQQMLDEAVQILEFNSDGYFLLQLENFQKCAKKNEKIALKILALALTEISGEIYKPRLEKLRQIFSWIVTEKNHKPKSFYGCILEKYDTTRLVIYRETRRN